MPDSHRHRPHAECFQCPDAPVFYQDVSLYCVSFRNDENRVGSATVSGDRQVRVFDVGEAVGQSPTGSELSYDTRQSCIRVLRCHSGRTKRIITEDSPDLFLTVAEVASGPTSSLRIIHWIPRMAKCVSMICVHHIRAHRALAPHRWWNFRTSSRRSHFPRSHHINLLWVVSRHTCVLVFLLSILILSAGYLSLVSHDISCVHVLKIAILRRTYSTVGMRGVTCVRNGV